MLCQVCRVFSCVCSVPIAGLLKAQHEAHPSLVSVIIITFYIVLSHCRSRCSHSVCTMNTQVPDDEGIVVFLLREYVIPFLVFGYMITWLMRNVAVPLYSEGFFLTRRPIHDGSSTQEGSDDDSKHKQH